MCLAIPGKIKTIEAKEGQMRMGKVDIGGIVKEVNLQLVPDAVEEDYVLIHVGVAISIVDEAEAKRTLAFLEQMNELDEIYNSPSLEETPAEEEEVMKQKINDIISKMNSK
jgi:hydrogenase expression/formation protein HypC